MSFLAIDVGNTRLKWALYPAARAGAQPLQQGVVFIDHIETLEAAWRGFDPPGALLACNVAGEAVRHRIQEQFEMMTDWEASPRWVVPQAEACGVKNGYDHPGRLGADRFVSHIGAWQRLAAQPGAAEPVLVVMIGTAVTVDAIDSQGHFLGGLILPGHGIMLSALHGGTAGLRVPTGEVRDFPCNTSDALTSGGTFAITGAIERQYRRLAQRCGRPPRLLMTGGAGWKVSPHLDVPHELVESLVFDGLLALQAEREARRRMVTSGAV